jgi:hypothetical protein
MIIIIIAGLSAVNLTNYFLSQFVMNLMGAATIMFILKWIIFITLKSRL